MWHRIIDRACANYHICSAERHSEAVRAPWGRTIEVLAINIIVRTMTGALETRTVGAKCVRTTKMDTTLVEGNPMGSIGPLDKALRTQLIRKITAT